MFSNVLMTALTPLCNTDENSCWQNRPFATIWPEDHQPTSTTRPLDQPKNIELKKTIKKKKRFRTAFSTQQIQVLEKTYYRLKYINADKRRQLAESLNIGEKSIKVWFQNRRMKEKRESSESSDSSNEATVLDESTPRLTMNPKTHKNSEQNSILTAPALQEIPRETIKVEMNQPCSDMYVKLEDNQLHSNPDQFSVNYYQDCNKYFNNQPESQYAPQSMLPPAKPFTNDRSIYPTSYYPTLVDYYLGESYQYESVNTNSTDMQWSANNFDLHYF